MNEAIQTLLTKIETSWGPAVLDVGAAITFWSCVNYLVTGFLLVLLGSIGVWGIRWIIRKAPSWEGEEKFSELSEGSVGAVVGVCFAIGTLSLIPTVIGLCMLLNTWNWVGVFNPRLRLAYDLYQAALRLAK